MTMLDVPGAKATAFNEREMQIVLVARMIEDARTYWVTGAGTPLYAMLLGKQLHSPNAQYITEDGVIAPEPMLPFEPLMSMVASRPGYRALAWGTMNTAGNHAQLGYMDYGILNALQIDRYGNINSTAIGTYGEEMRRFGGPGGADTISACCWRLIIMTDQEKRKFVERADFISSPGYLDGTPNARERAGLPRNTGPWRVVTPWALYDYDDERRLRLLAVAPFVTVDEVLEECEYKPRVAENIETLAVPTDEELDVLRSRLDVQGQSTGIGRSGWIVLDGEKYVRQAGD